MSTGKTARPPTTSKNHIVAYNQQLKHHAKTSGYFGDSPEAKKARTQFLTQYYEAVLNGTADKIDMFQLDAVRLNMTKEEAQKLYNEVFNKFKENAKVSRKSYRIFNTKNIQSNNIRDLRNFKNFRGSTDNLNYLYSERIINTKSLGIFISIFVIYDVI